MYVWSSTRLLLAGSRECRSCSWETELGEKVEPGLRAAPAPGTGHTIPFNMQVQLSWGKLPKASCAIWLIKVFPPLKESYFQLRCSRISLSEGVYAFFPLPLGHCCKTMPPGCTLINGTVFKNMSVVFWYFFFLSCSSAGTSKQQRSVSLCRVHSQEQTAVTTALLPLAAAA